MRAWQYKSTKNGIENSLHLENDASVPVPTAKQHLVQVIATALNPMDYKPAETPIVGRFAIPKPATPGLDFVGRIVQPAPGSGYKEGQLVFGPSYNNPFAGGALAEFAAVPAENVVPVPEGLSTSQAASIPMAAATAWSSIIPNVKPGSRIFVNGGSGGVGCFTIQVAKLKGAHVAASCSTANVEFCKSLGADEVVDYKKGSVVDQLCEIVKKSGKPFDYVIDNVGSDYNLYWKMHNFTALHAKYLFVGWGPSLSCFSFIAKAKVIPGFLGGGKRGMEMVTAAYSKEMLEQVAAWIVAGKLKAVIDSEYSFEQAPEAFRRSKSGRAVGKIVITVEAAAKSADR